MSAGHGPHATLRPCSRISTCVASRTTSSKSCVTRMSGISSVRRRRVDLVLQPPADGAVDGRERLVQQQHGGLARQRPCQRHPLALAARQLVRPAAHLPRQVHQLEQRFGARAPFAHADDAPSAVITLPSAVRCGKSAYSWKTNPTRAAMRRRERRPRPYPSTSRPPDRTVACAGRYRPAMRAEDRRLAAARRAEDRQHVARVAGELDVERDGTRLTEGDRQAAVSHGARPPAATARSSPSASPARRPAASRP